MKKLADCFSSLSNELTRESDRGSVLLAVCWMDKQLTCLIQTFLIDPKGDQDTFLKTVNFSQKIQLAYRLGLIRDDTYSSLELYRRLRNEFAHLSSPLTFKTTSVKGRVLDIFRLNKKVLQSVHDVAPGHIFPSETKPNDEIEALCSLLGDRKVFDICAALTVAGLLLTSTQVEKLQSQVVENS